MLNQIAIDLGYQKILGKIPDSKFPRKHLSALLPKQKYAAEKYRHSCVQECVHESANRCCGLIVFLHT